MAIISITIPDAALNRIVDAICDAYAYNSYVESGGTQTRNQFAKQQLINFVKTTVKNQEAGIAESIARSEVTTEIESINIT